MASHPEDDDLLYLHAEAAKKLHALYANRIFAQPLAEGLVRASFGEMSDVYDPSYHTAIVLTPEQAFEFANILTRVAQGIIRHQQEVAEGERAVKEAAEKFAAEHSTVADMYGAKKPDVPGPR